MPFKELKHKDSFPPTIVHISPSLSSSSNTNKPLPSLPTKPDLEIDIDSNPISFFLTTPTPEEEEDDFFNDDLDDGDDVFGFDEDLSAGIEGSVEDLRNEKVREVSPSSLQREREGESEDDEEEMSAAIFGRALLDGDSDDDEDEVRFGFAMPLSLRDYTARSLVNNASTPPLGMAYDGRTSHVAASSSSHRTGPHLTGLGIDIPGFGASSSSSREKDRGRGRVKLGPGSIDAGRVNRTGRSASLSPKPRKPVSWRVPSRGIWRIDEIDEEVRLSSSAPALGGTGILKGGFERDDVKKTAERKVKKRVHWAD